VLLFHFVNRINRTKYPASNQRQMVVIGQTLPEISYQLDTSKLVELLQQCAVQHLTTFRHFEAQEFSWETETITTDFEALYAYKRGDYQRCLRLSTVHNVQAMRFVFPLSPLIFPCPEFIQLMDEDIVLLIGLMMIVNPSCTDDHVRILKVSVRQLSLCLYLMAQCQMKLHQSLDQTLDNVEAARQCIPAESEFDHLLLKLTERKILMYICRE